MTDESLAKAGCFALCRDGSGSEGGALVVRLGGEWVVGSVRPALADVIGSVDSKRYHSVRFDTAELREWDTTLLVFIRSLLDWAEPLGLVGYLDELPEGAQNLIKLSQAVPESKSQSGNNLRGWLSALGLSAWERLSGFGRYCDFLGELLIDLIEFLRGRAQMRRSDFYAVLQSTGHHAVPIVCLLSFLTGLIIAFIGVVQLQKLAADIFVADLVGLATTRELGALMTGVIMSGRTGAAFAAQIGSMRVNEEIDAMTTFGISPMQFLVLPRVLAMVLMMPLLCVCANFVAMFGGMVVAVGISDVGMMQYIYQIDYAVSLIDLGVGIFKSVIFGIIIAIAGCYRGLNCGKDATAVGLATTSAVVTSITWIVIADALFAVSFHLLGI